MPKAKTADTLPRDATVDGIREIAVSGYKSIGDERSIEIRPLTLLAGANSSGKSSIMQPLLLMKQTLEQTYDPGALHILGPHVAPFDSFDQMFWKSEKGVARPSLSVRMATDRHPGMTLTYGIDPESRMFDVLAQVINLQGSRPALVLRPNMRHEEVLEALNKSYDPSMAKNYQQLGLRLSTVRRKCYLEVESWRPDIPRSPWEDDHQTAFEEAYGWHIRRTLHLPGVRRKPERLYPLASIQAIHAGTFEDYVPSLLADWSAHGSGDEKITAVSRELADLELTSRVIARRKSDVAIEIQVARPFSSASGEAVSMVSIVDVGIGVSQVLSPLVALQAAEPGQLVYLEQPELHLHPRAQTKLAGVLARAAKRGVRVVVETHSSLLLLAIQTLAAEGEIPPELVKLHWFEMKDGMTQIASADLDETGGHGDWPQDFAEVELDAEGRFIAAADARIMQADAR